MCGLTAKALPKNMLNNTNIELMKESNEKSVCQPSADVQAPELLAVQAPKKKVHFDGIVQVILIPSIQEYRDAQIFESIWWVASDYREFQLTMSVAFKKFITTTQCPNLKEALKMFILDELAGGSEVSESGVAVSVVPVVPDVGFKRAVDHIHQESSALNKRARV